MEADTEAAFMEAAFVEAVFMAAGTEVVAGAEAVVGVLARDCSAVQSSAECSRLPTITAMAPIITVAAPTTVDAIEPFGLPHHTARAGGGCGSASKPNRRPIDLLLGAVDRSV